MLPSEEERAKRIARSEALNNRVRNTQQASLFLSEVAEDSVTHLAGRPAAGRFPRAAEQRRAPEIAGTPT